MPSSRKISKAEKSLIAVCCLVVLPAAGIVYFCGGRDAEPNWNIAPAAPRPKPNGYDFYVAAAKATVRFKPEIDPASDTTSITHTPGSPYALKNYSLARRQQWLNANRRTFALVNQGLTTPSMMPDLAGGMSRDWGKLRQLARDMSVHSRTFQMQHQPMRATMSALDTMQMGQDTTRGGGLIPRLVGVAIVAIGRNPLDDWNKTVNELSASEARAAARRLEAIIARDQTAPQTLTIAKRDSLIELRSLFADKGWRRLLVAWNQSIFSQGMTQTWQTQTVSKQTVYDNVNRVLDAQIANAKRPYAQSKTTPPPNNLDPFSRYLVGYPNRMGANEARNTTSNTMLLLRLALRAYIAEHGMAPPILSALVPSYLKSIPTDVYNGGKPLFYTPQGKTYKLWSVGPDGINNGGVPFPPRNSKSKFPVTNTLDNTGDFVAGLCR